MEIEKTLMDENEEVITSLRLLDIDESNKYGLGMFKVLKFIALSNLFFFPQVSCFNLFILMCSKLFLVVLGIREQWMEQGCCCLPQTLNPKIGKDVT
jgi:hypothetical protein